MKFSQIFLQNLSKDYKEFLNLLDLTAKVHGENRHPVAAPGKIIWPESFYHLTHSSHWKQLKEDEQREILCSLGNKILQEAYFIESAGMAYAGKMNLAAKTKEEREFFCFVAEEEARHLRMVEVLTDFNKSLENIPSFALLIGEIIQEAKKPSHLLLIQILLEGWGLQYYKTLAKNSQDDAVTQTFKAILKDEIRHHSAGVILFNDHESLTPMSPEEANEFLSYLERISFMVKVGPYSAASEVLKKSASRNKTELKKFLEETDAVKVTAEKVEILYNLLKKSLPSNVLDEVQNREILKALTLSEMTDILFESIPEIFELP